jgi:cell division protein FtsL
MRKYWDMLNPVEKTLYGTITVIVVLVAAYWSLT